MDVLTLARVQFGMTTVFHFLFVPLSIGLGLAVAIMETMYVVKKEKIYKEMAIFWGEIFMLSFAVGVVTGLIQEFQFGMNWSEYSRFMGDIFGAPLAIEALLAFFLESTFLGLWAFTWDKVGKKLHLTFIWLVAFGSTLSALWILVANAFMQNPVGFVINETSGRAELDSFGALLKNPQLWWELPHVVFGAFVTGAFVIVGLSAWKMLRKEDVHFFRLSMKLGLQLGLVFSILTMVWGHYQTQEVISQQPMKFAAMEGIYEDVAQPAPWKVAGLMDNKNRKEGLAIEIPYLLTILGSSHEGDFKGMNTLNKELMEKYGDRVNDFYVPVNVLFWSFRFMAGFGSLLALLSMVGLFFMRQNNLETKRWFLIILAFSLSFPFIANTSGWLITELGRFPWTVYELFTIADSVSPSVTAGELLFTNIMYFLLFSLLGGVLVFLVKRVTKKGPHKEEEATTAVDPLAKEAF